MTSNQWANKPLGWGQAEHEAAGSLGGQDFKDTIGEDVRAWEAGQARRIFDGFGTILVVADADPQRQWRYKENQSFHGHYPRHVDEGELLAVAGLVRTVPRWAHVDLSLDGGHTRTDVIEYTTQLGASMGAVIMVKNTGTSGTGAGFRGSVTWGGFRKFASVATADALAAKLGGYVTVSSGTELNQLTQAHNIPFTEIGNAMAAPGDYVWSETVGGTVFADSEIVDEAELGQALTSTVSLVNEHADANKQAILDAIGSLTLSAG